MNEFLGFGIISDYAFCFTKFISNKEYKIHTKNTMIHVDHKVLSFIEY